MKRDHLSIKKKTHDMTNFEKISAAFLFIKMEKLEPIRDGSIMKLLSRSKISKRLITQLEKQFRLNTKKF